MLSKKNVLVVMCFQQFADVPHFPVEESVGPLL